MWLIVMLLLWCKLLFQFWEVIVSGRSRWSNFLLLGCMLDSHSLFLHKGHSAVKSTTFTAILLLHRVGHQLIEERLLWRVQRFLAWTLFFSCNDFLSWTTFDNLEARWASLALLCLRYFIRWHYCCNPDSLPACWRLFSDKRFVLKVNGIIGLRQLHWLLGLK